MSEQLTAQEAIQSLYELYSNDIYRYAKLTLGNSSDAYDVVQEVFLRAFRSWNNYRQDANAKTWLMSIARNHIVDLFRKKRTERHFLSLYEPQEVSNESTSAEAILEVEEALSKLKETYRQVIVLRHIENLSMQETAHILGWSATKVRTTTHRAMTKLREILGSNSEEVKFHNDIGTRHP
ncbi:RNA polymerase sigma factor [Alicyclobacillus pomorum]|uniref:RNA polymerase sigma factor n=1 Tax=Alicyclobacillus pomorum TaxID=204470 RepID=UPI0006860EF3|nr:RNA polymerase sigma factor [Alicyclobacillus pomorum]